MSHFAATDANAEKAFRGEVRRWCAEAIAAGARSFAQVLDALPGVDPVLAECALRALTAEAGDVGRAARIVAVDARRDTETSLPPTELPVPHPLEFYWRFDDATLERLVERVAALAPPGGGIAYLGAPNAFAAAGGLSDRRRILVDRSARRTRQLAAAPSAAVGILRLDLLVDDLPALEADVAVTDPPWYPEHLCGFLWAAASLVRRGGRVLAAFPPIGTRPGVQQERAEVLTFAEEVGLTLQRVEPGGVRYRTPPFEHASHLAAGLRSVPASWRRGDLLELRREGDIGVSRPPAPAHHNDWHGFLIGDVPLFVHRRTHTGWSGEPLLVSLVEGDILQTVSRRDPARANVALWTSRNRVFASPAPDVLAGMLTAMERGDRIEAVAADALGDELSHAQTLEVRRTTERLRRLVARERAEHGLDAAPAPPPLAR
jgi:hypothetical protein